jgi:uncharacterized protein (AIM24 family)
VWFYLPNGAHLSRVSAHRKPTPTPVVVAAGGAVVKRRGKVKLKIRLTAEGRRLLQGVTRVKLSGEGTFAISGRPHVLVVASFSLVR